jgi:hypothetical protein
MEEGLASAGSERQILKKSSWRYEIRTAWQKLPSLQVRCSGENSKAGWKLISEWGQKSNTLVAVRRQWTAPAGDLPVNHPLLGI